MDIDHLAIIVRGQADALFPHRTDASMYLKLYSEIAEIIESNGSSDEVADAFIMLLDYAARKNIVLTDAILNKMEVNERRQWCLTPAGTYQHV